MGMDGVMDMIETYYSSVCRIIDIDSDETMCRKKKFAKNSIK